MSFATLDAEIRAAREVGIRFHAARGALAALKVSIRGVLTEEAEVAETSDTARSLLRASSKRSLWNYALR